MTKWHGYIGFENLALNTARRNALHQAITTLGPNTDPQPARILHWRTRPDNNAAIYEAAFNPANVDLAAWKARLATLFNVDPSTITHHVQLISFGHTHTRLWTLSRNATDYMRIALFGDASATWEASRQETLAYLQQNYEDWQPPPETLLERATALRYAPQNAIRRLRHNTSDLLTKLANSIRG